MPKRASGRDGRKGHRRTRARRGVLEDCIAACAAEGSRLFGFDPAAAREAAETWLTVHAFAIAAERAEDAAAAGEWATGRAEALRAAYRAVVDAHHPDAPLLASDAVLFSRDEDLLRRALRAAPRVSTLELACLLVSDVPPEQLAIEVLASVRARARAMGSR